MARRVGEDEGIRLFESELAAAEAGTIAQPAASQRWIDLGVLLATDGRWADAADVFAKAIALEESPLALNLLAEARITLEDTWGARHLLMRSIELMPENSRAAFLMGRCSGQRDHADAEKWFSLAVQIEPNDGEAHSELAQILWMKGRLPAAMEHAQKAVKLFPDDPFAPYRLAGIAQDMGDLPVAIEHHAIAIAMAPSLGLFRCGLGGVSASSSGG